MKKDRSEYFKEYKKKLVRTQVDLKPEERKKLDEIIKKKNITLIGWIREQIEQEYNKL